MVLNPKIHDLPTIKLILKIIAASIANTTDFSSYEETRGEKRQCSNVCGEDGGTALASDHKLRLPVGGSGKKR